MSERISVIVPTMGRAELHHIFHRILPELGDRDEVIMVADRELPFWREHLPDWRFKLFELDNVPEKNYGCLQRDHGLRAASGTHICYMDDDDMPSPSAISLIRSAIQSAPNAPHIFCMLQKGRVVGIEQKFLSCHVGTPMFVHPNLGDRSPRWNVDSAESMDYQDYEFMRQAVQILGTPVWHKEIISYVKGCGEWP